MDQRYIMPLPLRAFDWNKRDCSLSAEASTCRFKKVEQLYHDACDVGIAIESPTGKVERFYLANVITTRGGDIGGWQFEACPENKSSIETVTIYND
jgi:hypothetical protein